MRGDIEGQFFYYTHLFELARMSLVWDKPHRLPVEFYKAGKKSSISVKERLFRF
ncbi:hypothetical protein [Rhodohalobacter sp. SW132]|uniref:hypothetical protein n=1 Tax=Rhodohalobacter sp. SW132 TaxID=2293433 RepID=UPI001315A9DF|nr:hypothetical protein [Rhodohalobacter sp. SW132]